MTEPERRKEICRECDERPAGCWKAIEYGCQRARYAAEAAAAFCPIGKWGSLHLPSVKTFVYTCPKYPDRQRRISGILDSLGFSDWQFVHGRTNIPQWHAICLQEAELLREYEPPLLILEDDANLWTWREWITPPPGSELAYLGGSAEGTQLGRRRGLKAGMFPSGHTYVFQPIDSAWMRIAGMFTAHAILWLDKFRMLEIASLWETLRIGIDTWLSDEQYRWQAVCLYDPIFWQDDGHRSTLYTNRYRPREAIGPPLTRSHIIQGLREQRLMLTR